MTVVTPAVAASAIPRLATLPLPPRPLGERLADEDPQPQADGERAEAAASEPWLVIIDPQRIFADPSSEWASPMWAEALPNIRRLAERFQHRTVITRWVPPSDAERRGSWRAYMAAWPFADKPADDPVFDVVPELADIEAQVVSEPTFGKWGDQLASRLGPEPAFVLVGVSTDCCVISTALPAADDGATLTVVTDACAGSTPENHAAACTVLGLYPPQITLATTDEVLASLLRC